MELFFENIFKSLLDPWLVFGFAAQFIFFLRFIVQWLASEKSKNSIVPTAFWYLSIIGSIMILIYALKKGDPVFVIGQLMALAIYIRNIILIGKNINRDTV